MLPAAVDLGDVAYVRQSGTAAGVTAVPRVLLPLPVDDGEIDLATLRNPSSPAEAIDLAVAGRRFAYGSTSRRRGMSRREVFSGTLRPSRRTADRDASWRVGSSG